MKNLIWRIKIVRSCILPLLLLSRVTAGIARQDSRSDCNYRVEKSKPVLPYERYSRFKLFHGITSNSLVLPLGKGSLTLDVEHLTCLPVYNKENNVFVVGYDGDVECYSGKGKLLWQEHLPYYYNPFCLVATPITVTYSLGPLSAGVPHSEAEVKPWKRYLNRVSRSVTKKIRTGETMWDRSYESIGNPCAPWGQDKIVTVNSKIGNSLSEILSDDDAQGLSFLELHSAFTGRCILRWRLPRWVVRREGEAKEGLALLLVASETSVWLQGSNSNHTYTVYERRDQEGLQVDPVKHGFLCKLTFDKSGILKLHCISPINRVAVISPVQATFRRKKK